MPSRSPWSPETWTLGPEEPNLPAALGHDDGSRHWTILHGLGDPDLLARRYVGLFASIRCPGAAILRAYDLARELRDANIPVIGGFHSPMERECLDLLLRGRQPVAIVPARGVQTMRIPRAWRPAIDAGRLIVISPFGVGAQRVTSELAVQRNDLVEALSAALLIVHAAPGGKIERLAITAARTGKPVFLATPGARSPLGDLGHVADTRSIGDALCDN